MDNIFIESLFKTNLQCNAKSLSKDINSTLLEMLKQQYEGKCNKDGYIMEDSVSIVKRSLPYVYGSQMNSNIKYTIVYKANVCCPMTDNIIKCKIDKINKLGVLCIKQPLTIIVAKEFHKNTNIFKNLKEGDEIEIKIIDKKFNVNDKNIQVIARLNNEPKDDITDSETDTDMSDIENEPHINQKVEYSDSDDDSDEKDTSDSDNESLDNKSSDNETDKGNTSEEEDDETSEEEDDETSDDDVSEEAVSEEDNTSDEEE